MVTLEKLPKIDQTVATLKSCNHICPVKHSGFKDLATCDNHVSL